MEQPVKYIEVNYELYAFKLNANQELRALFEAYGEVMEADVISEKNYGFVHVDAGMGEEEYFLKELINPIFFPSRAW